MFARPPIGFSHERAERAVEIALDFARRNGLAAESGELISEGANLLVRIEPGPALARISNWIDILRVDGSLPWHRREVIVGRHLGEAGLEVARPLVAPICEAGITKSIWTWLEHDPHVTASDEELGGAVARIHDALATCDDPLIDLADVLREVELLAPYIDKNDALLGSVADALPRRMQKVLDALPDFPEARYQPIHGDAHGGNVVGIDGALVWIDFEDACRGPVEYDLAVATFARPPRDRARIAAGYGRPVDLELLDLMIEARRCQSTCWFALLMPEWSEPGARERLESWLAANG